MARCDFCRLNCELEEGETGKCGVIVQVQRRVVNLHAGRALFATVTPVEAIPFYHFYPGARAFTIWSTGCPPRCALCPYKAVSGDFKSSSLRRFNIVDMVDLASKQKSGVFMVNGGECGIHKEWIISVLEEAKKSGFPTAFKTLGLAGPDAYRSLSRVAESILIEHIAPLLRGASAKDMHAPTSYKDLVEMYEHIEIVVPYVRGISFSDYADDPALGELPRVDREIPIHVIPYSEAEAQELYRLREVIVQLGMRYVYIPKDPLLKHVNTYCWKCGRIVIERDDVGLVRSLLRGGACPHCNSKIRVTGKILEEKWKIFRLLVEEIVW